MKRRYGLFYLDADQVRAMTPDVTRIMGSCSIFRAEHDLMSNKVEYRAISWRFREVAEGEIAPRYEWLFNSDGDMWCVEVEI